MVKLKLKGFISLYFKKLKLLDLFFRKVNYSLCKILLYVSYSYFGEENALLGENNYGSLGS